MPPFTIPQLCLVVLVGPSGAGKSTFARKHFKSTEIVSSDFCRGLVSDDENSMEATGDAFDVLKYIAAKRLARGLLTVIDATNVQPESRRPMVELAREHDVLPVAVVLNMPPKLCHERNSARPDRNFGPHVVRNQCQDLRRSLRRLQREGFRYIHMMDSPEAAAEATFERQALWNDRRSDAGPFDIIGDVHGCYDELCELLKQLGYQITDRGDTPDGSGVAVVAPPGRKAIFLGDLVDRGPGTPAVLRLVMSMVEAGTALCVPGNHDAKLLRKLHGKDVKLTHGLAETMRQLELEPPEFLSRVAQFIDKLVSHYVLDGGRLVVAHAGMKEQYIGRASARVRAFSMYGETTGETDEFGLPVRHPWAGEYRGHCAVVYGHTPVPEAQWLNNTLNIDTGCVFGGKLTALRWPERELVSVPAMAIHAESSKPFLPADAGAAAQSPQQQNDDVLDIEDVLGKRIINTRLSHTVTIPQENAAAALEVMSRFAANPKWLIYLPPTMSPTETTTEPGLLEHPREAYKYFQQNGVDKIVCEQKHMGSRAVVVICRDEAAVLRRFGISDDGIGIIYTRTGRRFFEDKALEGELLSRIHGALDAAGFWETFQSDWFCLDCELMPWSVKAQDLLRNQYAAVGAAARAALAAAACVVERADARYRAAGIDMLGPLLSQCRERLPLADKFVEAYRHYCWPVDSVADLRLAPFHLLASEGAVHVDKDHVWHMETLATLCDASPGDAVLMRTPFQVIEIADPGQCAAGIRWWEELTGSGGEGMVVKPLSFVVRGKRGLVQPAIKCRGPEYLRIIYGPEYTLEGNLARLRQRGVSAKRSLALREFALGVEALERFTRNEPLRRVHECVFGVLAMESEPVDPRL